MGEEGQKRCEGWKIGEWLPNTIFWARHSLCHQEFTAAMNIWTESAEECSSQQSNVKAERRVWWVHNQTDYTL